MENSLSRRVARVLVGRIRVGDAWKSGSNCFYSGLRPIGLLDFTPIHLDRMCPSSTLTEETPMWTGSWGSSTCQMTTNCLCKLPAIVGPFHEQHHNVCELFHFLLIGICESLTLQLCTWKSILAWEVAYYNIQPPRILYLTCSGCCCNFFFSVGMMQNLSQRAK